MVVPMVDVESSNIAQVGYHEGTTKLVVVFKSGAVYVYFGVEPEVYAELLAAESKGRFLNTRIKPSYRYLRLDSVDG